MMRWEMAYHLRMLSRCQRALAAGLAQHLHILLRRCTFHLLGGYQLGHAAGAAHVVAHAGVGAVLCEDSARCGQGQRTTSGQQARELPPLAQRAQAAADGSGRASFGQVRQHHAGQLGTEAGNSRQPRPRREPGRKP
jgi:hypothetical protein